MLLYSICDLEQVQYLDIVQAFKFWKNHILGHKAYYDLKILYGFPLVEDIKFHGYEKQTSRQSLKMILTFG